VALRGYRGRLERLCRYLCWPPIAQERLEEHPSGKLRHAQAAAEGRHRPRSCSSRWISSRGCALSCLHLGCTWCAATACSARMPRLGARSCPSCSP